jgi:hypothetical protein
VKEDFMENYAVPKTILKLGGAAGIAAGILMIAGFALHPAGEDATFGTDPYWVPAHGLLWIAYTLALVGWIGLYIVQASRAGGLGVAGFVIIIIGTSLDVFRSALDSYPLSLYNSR